MTYRVIVEYKDKKHSSARLRGDAILLSISSRLSPKEREIHKEKLLRRIQSRFVSAEAYGRNLEEGPYRDDGDLAELARRINEQHYGYDLKAIRFFPQHAQWGSCNPKTGIIHISHRLQGAPRELVEYVVVHELCHLKEANHSDRFWALVAKACPDHKARRKALTAYGLLMTKAKEQ